MRVPGATFFVRAWLAALLLMLVQACAQPNGTTPQAPGTVALFLTDAPVRNGLGITITIQEVQVRETGGEWRTIAEGPWTGDLVLLKGVEESLGTASLPPGRYRELRFRVSDPGMSHEGTPTNIKLGAERPTFPMDLDLRAGGRAEVIVDIDPYESFAFPGDTAVFEAKAEVRVR